VETTSIRTDNKPKKEIDQLFADAVREQGLPFLPTRDVPNAETIAAMHEADRIAADPNAHGCSTVDELFHELDSQL
jgi:DNA-damage-inducible protein J